LSIATGTGITFPPEGHQKRDPAYKLIETEMTDEEFAEARA
jgi:hypothetical protein